ncbi:hypothetical protein QR77_09330 [Streptomyces sp. 150FB]|uniref:hypothetical protein n=1 Tax=Streptomyces sp. 150FB TaxID=1576605 RepID=UPI0005895F93|nr:hypothetical protein [Streptomyces sp. 150FB]KIF74139.1 hypothetical protein QR77_09330 [Streptomyces sp. 150FB]
MGALIRSELFVEVLSQAAQLLVATGPGGVLATLLCWLLVRTVRDSERGSAGLLCATSVLLVLVLIATG